MSSYNDQASAAAALQNPALTGQDLMDIAYAYPALGATVARHPSVYPGLLDWLKQYGLPDAQAAASGQGASETPAAAPVAPAAEWPPASSSAGSSMPADYTVLASAPSDAAPPTPISVGFEPSPLTDEIPAAGPVYASITPDPQPVTPDVAVPPPMTYSPVPATPQPTYYPPAANLVPDAPSGGFAFLGFLIPLVGLILFLVWKDQTPLKAKSAGKGALIGVIVSFVLLIIYFVFIAVLINSFNY